MSEEKDTLWLLDAYALIYRAYFAFSQNQMINSKGLNTSAIYGFTSTLYDVLSNHNPTHIAVVFDTDKPTSRHIEFEAYKANREAMPDDIKSAIPYIKKIIEGFNIPILYSDGYEADDVIGTLAKKAEAEGYTTYMMTPDKDFGQLVSEHIFMYKPARMGNKAEVWAVQYHPEFDPEWMSGLMLQRKKLLLEEKIFSSEDQFEKLNSYLSDINKFSYLKNELLINDSLILNNIHTIELQNWLNYIKNDI